MRLTLLQQDILWAAPATNLVRAEQAIDSAPGSDLYVLPEMFATGFNGDPKQTAQDADHSTTLSWMLRMADKHNAAIAGSVAIRETNGSFYNRLYFVRPDGETIHYDKRHLFTYSGENLNYTPGNRRIIVEWRGVRFLLQVCYDLRFPVWSRNGRTTDKERLYDAIIYVASWPASRMEVWNTLLRARAIENQCYVCGVNRVGSDPSCNYSGGSMLVDPYGKTTVCPDNEECALTAELDMQKLQAFRSKFPVLNDMD